MRLPYRQWHSDPWGKIQSRLGVVKRVKWARLMASVRWCEVAEAEGHGGRPWRAALGDAPGPGAWVGAVPGLVPAVRRRCRCRSGTNADAAVALRPYLRARTVLRMFAVRLKERRVRSLDVHLLLRVPGRLVQHTRTPVQPDAWLTVNIVL